VHDCKPLVGGAVQRPQLAALRGRSAQVDPIKPMLKPTGTKHLKLKRDELLSSFAFKFNLRRYIVEGKALNDAEMLCDAAAAAGIDREAGVYTRPLFSSP